MLTVLVETMDQKPRVVRLRPALRAVVEAVKLPKAFYAGSHRLESTRAHQKNSRKQWAVRDYSVGISVWPTARLCRRCAVGAPSTARNEQRPGAKPEAQQIKPCHGNAGLGGIAPKMTVRAMNTPRAHAIANQNSCTVRLLVCMAVDLDVMVVIQGILKTPSVRAWRVCGGSSTELSSP